MKKKDSAKKNISFLNEEIEILDDEIDLLKEAYQKASDWEEEVRQEEDEIVSVENLAIELKEDLKKLREKAAELEEIYKDPTADHERQINFFMKEVAKAIDTFLVLDKVMKNFNEIMKDIKKDELYESKIYEIFSKEHHNIHEDVSKLCKALFGLDLQSIIEKSIRSSKDLRDRFCSHHNLPKGDED